jgi:hypothetical protein
MIDNEDFRNMRGMIKHDIRHGKRSAAEQEACPAVDRSPTSYVWNRQNLR